jgi:hypothetical protein
MAGHGLAAPGDGHRERGAGPSPNVFGSTWNEWGYSCRLVDLVQKVL